MSEHPYAGRIVWHDLMTTDPEKSKAFFAELFGWTTEERDMHGGVTYTTLKTAGKPFGGLVPLEPDAGIPSHWISYVTTDDVDAFCARASDMGATIAVQPTDIPGVGRFAVVADAQGAWFSPFSEAERTPSIMPNPQAEPGQVVWSELMTSDPAAATAFYTRMFGWDSQVMDIGTGPYTLLQYSGIPVAGIGQKDPGMPVSAWTLYFEVENIDASVENITSLGGTILFPPMHVPTVGFLSWATDPAGAVFALMQSDPPGTQQ
ncbi:MAG: VOC family protein [Thermomicrobiales bacterium]